MIGEFFKIIGFVTCAAITVTILWLCVWAIKEYFLRQKWRRAIKQRFSKPPLAKCYCIDCESYSKHSGECCAHTGWFVADDWFCWAATPSAREKREDNHG
jgi:hypothetical protein